MPVIFRRPRGAQPQQPAVNPATRAIASGAAQNFQTDLAGAAITLYTGTRSNDSLGYGVVNPRSQITALRQLGLTYSIVVVAKGGNPGNADQFLSSDDAASARYFQFRLDGSNAVTLIRFDSGGNWSASAPGLNIARPYVAIAVADGSLSSVYAGNIGGVGTTTATASSANTPVPASAVAYLGQRDSAGDNGFSGTEYAYFILPYALTPTAARSIVANPWQLFAPQPRKLWVADQGGGAGVSAALAGTATSAAAGGVSSSLLTTLAGAAGASSAGTPRAAPSYAITGQQALGSAGSVSSTSITVALTGVQAAAAAGFVSAGSNVTRALSGAASVGSAGSVGVQADVVVALSGAQSSWQAGSVADSSIQPPAPAPAPSTSGGGGIYYGRDTKFWKSIHDEVRDKREAEEIIEIITALCAAGVLD